MGRAFTTVRPLGAPQSTQLLKRVPGPCTADVTLLIYSRHQPLDQSRRLSVICIKRQAVMLVLLVSSTQD